MGSPQINSDEGQLPDMAATAALAFTAERLEKRLIRGRRLIAPTLGARRPRAAAPDGASVQLEGNGVVVRGSAHTRSRRGLHPFPECLRSISNGVT